MDIQKTKNISVLCDKWKKIPNVEILVWKLHLFKKKRQKKVLSYFPSLLFISLREK